MAAALGSASEKRMARYENPTLVLVRGLPGSGKTTLAQAMGRLAGNDERPCTPSEDRRAIACAADDFMLGKDGNYQFDPRKLRAAHEACQAATAKQLRGGGRVVVHNTFSQKWEMAPYLALAALCGATVEVVDLFDAGLTDDELAARNVHGVPVGAIAAMRARWEK